MNDDAVIAAKFRRSGTTPTRVTAAILVENARLLLARRPGDDPLAGLWELPGGKIEAGESPEQCLARELAEECGLRVTVGNHFATSHYRYPHIDVHLEAYWIDSWSGQLALRAHDEYRWVSAEELDGLALAPADIPILERLHDELA